MFKKSLKIILSSIIITFTYSYANSIYTIPLQKQKSSQIQNALQVYQYKYDLNRLNDILKKLYYSKSFKEASTTAELAVKNVNSKYSTEYIEALLKILNATDPTDDRVIGYYDPTQNIGGGYLKEINDLFNDEFKMYLINYPVNSVITKNFDSINTNIKTALDNLKYKLNRHQNIRPALKTIFQNLIFALKEIEQETVNLKNLHIIHPFTTEDDDKYLMPKNWAQTDGDTDLAAIINFILNGDKHYNLLGIKYYYDKVYKDDSKPLVIDK